MTKVSAARLRINAKKRDVCLMYQEAVNNNDSIETVVDQLARKHKCTRDSIRKIITDYRAGKIIV